MARKRPYESDKEESEDDDSSSDEHIDDEDEDDGNIVYKDMEWDGPPIQKVGDDTYYAAVIKDDVHYRVGDCVLLRVEHEEGMWVASIESLFQSGGDAESFQAETRWFYRPGDIRRKSSSVRYGEREILESDHVDVNEVVCFQCKALVLTEQEFVKLGAIKGDGEVRDGVRRSDVYYCRLFYSSETGRSRAALTRTPGIHSKRMTSGVAGGLGRTTVTVMAEAADAGVGVATDPFSRACAQLQLSAVPASLPCRESERSKIFDFLEGAITRGGLGCALYVSGMPGTGKTATVHEVVRELLAKHARGDLPAFEFVEINGMKLPHPYQAYTELYKALTGKHASHGRAVQMLEKRFSSSRSGRPVCVLLVDELDYMVTQKQTVLYNLFDWPTRKHARLVVVGIANTMDLPERMLPRIHSRLGMGRVVFQPYTRTQIETIVKARLRGLDVFQPEAIEICARKVASISGDVRRALQICRRATEVCLKRQVASGASGTSNRIGRANASLNRISMSHITSAAKELCSTLHLKAMRSAPLCEQLFLLAVYKQVHASGRQDCHFDDVHRRFKTLYSEHQSAKLLSDLSTNEVRALCRRIGASRLLILEQGPDKVSPTMRLGVQPDDVKFALSENRCMSNLF